MVNVLNIPLYNFSLGTVVGEIIDQCLKNGKNNYCISATGAHGLVYSKKKSEFAKILRDYHYNLPDGMPGVWVGRLKGAKEMERCYGPDFFKNVFNQTATYDIKHYFCGGREGVALELKAACEEKFNNRNIVGTFSPPFRDMTEDELKILADNINSKNTDIVWIGLSTPKQEVFASRLSKYTNVHYIATVGAAFDFHTGKVKQAPT
jgi:N-acetylglucosaminyldiphosphoundecaprenol N-acetyl-beta-D-mannosaminyltransferase